VWLLLFPSVNQRHLCMTVDPLEASALAIGGKTSALALDGKIR